MAKSKKQESCSCMDIHDRTIIEIRYCYDGKSFRAIAREIGRSPSTVKRDIDGRPRKGTGRYTAVRAQQEAEERRHRGGRKRKMDYAPLYRYVKKKLKLGWSPEQISMRLKEAFPDDERMQVSHETIYTFIYAQVHRKGHGMVKQGKEDLRLYLPRKRKRRMRKGMRKAQKMERNSTLPSIERRPKVVEKRKEIGHWEGDTMVSRKSKTRIKSMNELVSGVVFFAKTDDGTAEVCNQALITRMQDVSPKHRITLTQDRGNENMDWETVEKHLGISCYFAHPYCSHERGANENANGLFRRHFPKGTDFGKIKDKDIAKVEYLINTRPRKRLNGLTPYEVFYHRTGIDLEPVAYSRMTGVAREP